MDARKYLIEKCVRVMIDSDYDNIHADVVMLDVVEDLYGEEGLEECRKLHKKLKEKRG